MQNFLHAQSTAAKIRYVMNTEMEHPHNRINPLEKESPMRVIKR